MTPHRLLAFAVLAVAAPVVADDAPTTAVGGPMTEVGRARLLAGDTAFAANDFARASTEYAAGYAAERWSGFLFAWAQAQRLRGDCPSATELYERFLATTPPPKIEQMARDALAACGASPTTTVTPPPPPDDTSLEKIELRPAPPPEQPFPHKLAVVLVGTGLATSAIGLTYYVRARGDGEDASRQATHQEAIALYDRAQDRTLVARVTGGLGAALVIAGVVRFALNRPATESTTTVVLVPNGIEIAGRF